MSVFLFLFPISDPVNFSFSGPYLPKTISGHSMLEYGDSLLLIGGVDGVWETTLRTILSLTCEARVCFWTELSQKLDIGRAGMVTAILPDSMTDC